MSAEKKTKKDSFEAQLNKLEKLVARIESGELGLDDTIKLFEEGMTLAAQCREVLDHTELRIRKLTESQGRLRSEPFEPNTTEES